MVGAIVNSAVSWSGNYWRDRVGGRQICLGFGPWALTGIIGFACPFTYVLFSVSFLSYDARYLFTIVLFWTVWNNFFGGFASAGGGALGAGLSSVDCGVSMHLPLPLPVAVAVALAVGWGQRGGPGRPGSAWGAVWYQRSSSAQHCQSSLQL